MTPIGMPACRKPMKSGTAEQEQKGVMMPKSAAATVPPTTFLPASAARTRSGGTYERRKLTSVTMPSRSSSTLGTS